MIDDGMDVYSIDKDGRRQYATSTNMKWNGEDVFKFDPETGVLDLSMEQKLVDALIEQSGGLPAEHVTFQEFLGRHHFQNVKEIRPLARKDGSYFIQEKRNEPEPKKGWFRRLFG